MLALRSEKSIAVVRATVSTIRANFAAHLDAFNVELIGDIVLVQPANYMIEARAEQSLEDGAFPAGFGGVRVRAVEYTEAKAVSIGEARGRTVLEVRTTQNVQDNQPDTTAPGTASSGYVTVGYLAELVDDIVRSHMIGQVGIYRIDVIRGAQPKTPPKSMPSLHESLWTYEVLHRVRRPIPGEAMAGHGSWFLDTQDVTQAVLDGVSEAVDVATSPGPLEGVTHTSPGVLTVQQPGTYRYTAISTFAHSMNNTRPKLNIRVDGADQLDWEQFRKVGTGGDIGNASISGDFTVAADTEFSLSITADNDGNITWHRLAADLHLIS